MTFRLRFYRGELFEKENRRPCLLNRVIFPHLKMCINFYPFLPSVSQSSLKFSLEIENRFPQLVFLFTRKKNIDEPGEAWKLKVSKIGQINGLRGIETVNELWISLQKKESTPWSPPTHTSYLSRIPRIYPCKFFLAGVNFYRFYAKNWRFSV